MEAWSAWIILLYRMSNGVEDLSSFPNFDNFLPLMTEALKVTPLTQWAPITILSAQDPMGYFTSDQEALVALVKIHRNQEEESNPGILCHFFECSHMT